MAHMDSDMTEGSIWRHLLQFSIPMAIGLLFQQLYNTVDTLVVGRFVGQQAQAAVGSTGAIINTVVGFCAGLATGASVVISQRYGAHDVKGLSRAVHTELVRKYSVFQTPCGLLPSFHLGIRRRKGSSRAAIIMSIDGRHWPETET